MFPDRTCSNAGAKSNLFLFSSLPFQTIPDYSEASESSDGNEKEHGVVNDPVEKSARQ